MSRIDPFGAGLTLGLLVGGAHVLWTALAGSVMGPPFGLHGFDLGVAAFLVVMTTFAGLGLGWAFAAVWNGLATLRAAAPIQR